jgi:tripartite-type tricarboxylate transporter receptor subunit TctC
MKPIVRISLRFACAMAIAAAAAVHGQDRFPSKPVRIIVPVPPGGNLDAVTRAVGERLSLGLGQPVVVENRTGASSSVGTRYVAQSPADGYTLLAIGNTFLSTPIVMPSAGEFLGVSLICRVTNILVVPASSPFKTASDLVAHAKAKPGEVSYGTAGAGSVGHIAGERFSRHVGAQFLHIPYKGNAPAMVDLVGARVGFMFDQVSSSSGHIRSGRLRALGVASLQRSPILPEVPTLDEMGIKGFEDYTLNGFMAPAGVPREVMTRLHAEVVKALQWPELRSRFASQGVDADPSPSYEQFTAFVRDEVARYTKLARDANIKVE